MTEVGINYQYRSNVHNIVNMLKIKSADLLFSFTTAYYYYDYNE